MWDMSVALRHIAFVAAGYPSRSHPYRGAFVRQLVEALTEAGVRCTVIHPLRIQDWFRERGWEGTVGLKQTSAGLPIEVHRPATLSVSNMQLGRFNTFAITLASFRRAVWRALGRLSRVPDALYGHFLYPAGATAVRAAHKLRLPGFVAVGEGNFWTVRPVGVVKARRDFAPVTGAVAVSTVLRRKLVSELGFSNDHVGVFPNGVDTRKFYPRDRAGMRSKHGLPADQFLVIFVGNFIASKGIGRVAAAIKGLEGVSGMFVGSGGLVPKLPNMAYCGCVAHAEVPELLSAADCFVLPSDVEGSSNATVEAMACGLPVVVSAGEFNDDLFRSPVGIRVDPQDVAAIQRAVLTLQREPSLRERFGRNALTAAQGLDIRQRARGILAFMQGRAPELKTGWSAACAVGTIAVWRAIQLVAG